MKSVERFLEGPLGSVIFVAAMSGGILYGAVSVAVIVFAGDRP